MFENFVIKNVPNADYLKPCVVEQKVVWRRNVESEEPSKCEASTD